MNSLVLEVFFIFFWGFLKDAELRPLVASGWWSGIFGGLILVIILTGDHSPASETKQKRKKSKKRSRSRSPHDTTGHSRKKRIKVFKRCGRCRCTITVTDTHDLCLVCLGMEHPMLNCNQCMAFTWKNFSSSYANFCG